MTQSSREPVKVRVYQAVLDVTEFFQLQNFKLPRPWPTKIVERVLFTPDVAWHWCSAERLLDLEHLSYEAWFDDEGMDEDALQEARETWDSALLSIPIDSDSAVTSVGYNNVVKDYRNSDDPADIVFQEGYFEQVCYQGLYWHDRAEHGDDAGNWQDAIEYACGNYLVG